MNPEARKYLTDIGRKGGQKSRRKLTKAQARAMVRARTAKRAALRQNTKQIDTMRTITSYTRHPKTTAQQTPEQRTLHQISVPFLGTWTVTDRALQRMRTEAEAEIIGKRFSRETLTAHFASLEAPQATAPHS